MGFKKIKPRLGLLALGMAAVLAACSKGPTSEQSPSPTAAVAIPALAMPAAEPVASNTPAIVYDMGGQA